MFRLRVPAFGFQCPASGLGFGVLVGKILRYRISPDPRQDTGLLVPDGKYSGSGRPTDDLHYKYRFLNLKKEVLDILDQSSQFHSRQGKVPYLEDLILRYAYDRLTLAVTIDQGKIYAHCSTSTTLLTGSSHDLQLISRVPPCSLKHLDTSCSLQHIDSSTICSGLVPPRTDDSYELQSYVPPSGYAPI
ncbi:hypothetical protein DY000_02059755 [Brassica cretica]|uniref:Uncharacterized protein n=1 Tax=Brassica cretica TaxID=69181 RepID=A0ABQ7ANH6_BRACR|nr:hypothetical protein DY000_02059755 [Brassica cretica]